MKEVLSFFGIRRPSNITTISCLGCCYNEIFRRWQKYQHLWAFDKSLSCEKYIQKYEQIHKYDEKFFFFEDIISDLNKHVKFVDVGAVRVNLRPIIRQVQEHAQEWKTILGCAISSKTKMNMYDLKNQIEVAALFNLIENFRIIYNEL